MVANFFLWITLILRRLTPGALFQHLLRVGSEPTPAQCPLYCSDFQISVLHLIEAVLVCSLKKLSGVRLAMKYARIEDANKST